MKVFKKINISIIIVNYNVEKELIACISSIYDSKSKINFEIIVVDNSEKDLVSNKLSRVGKVKYIKTKQNIGYGAAINMGAGIAKGEYLFILNPDTKLVSGTLDSLVSFSRKQKKVGVVAPLLFDKNNKAYNLQGTKVLTPKRAIFSLSILSKLISNNKIYKDYYLNNWDKEKIKEVDIVPGTAFLIKKELFESIGGFDEKFFLFFEEFDLGKRLKDKGYKNFIDTSVKFYHKWGASTKKNPKTEKYFEKSRFYYFKKNYGLLNALITESILRVNKYTFFLIAILLCGIFLRVDKLPDLMHFVADQGLFYLPAKDMATQGIIPLVGPETSHPWIHHGAHWIYTLATIFLIFGFNPIVPGYFMAIVGVITIVVLYFAAKEMFGRNIAVISTVLFTTSPFIVINSRIPYHTSPIPLFVITLFYLTYKWVRGSVWVFPLITFLLGVLYNHEITTFVFAISVGVVLFYGFIKKEIWYKKLLNLKIIVISIIAFIIPMLPFIIYDTSHGYNQTFRFLIWVVYRIVKFPLSLLDPRFKSSGSSPSTIPQFFAYYKEMIFAPSDIIALLILIITGIFIVVYLYRNINFTNFPKIKVNLHPSFALLLLFSLISLSGLATHRVPIGADTLLISPFIILFTAVSILWISKNKFYIAFLIVCIIAAINVYMILSTNYFSNINGVNHITIKDQLRAADEVISVAGGKEYNLKGKGTLDTFKSFTMPYEYLLWWKGHPPSKNDVHLDITIWVKGNDIIILKNNDPK